MNHGQGLDHRTCCQATVHIRLFSTTPDGCNYHGEEFDFTTAALFKFVDREGDEFRGEAERAGFYFLLSSEPGRLIKWKKGFSINGTVKFKTLSNICWATLSILVYMAWTELFNKHMNYFGKFMVVKLDILWQLFLPSKGAVFSPSSFCPSSGAEFIKHLRHWG